MVGHGFPRRPESRHPAHDHAERLQGVDHFDEVSPALLKGKPGVDQAFESITAGRVIVVPLFVSDGYFVGTALPDRVEESRPESVTVEYARPIGTHSDLTEVIEQRALSAVEGATTDVELALIGHGSEHGAANREAVGSHARRIAEQDHFSTVRSYFVDEAPGVELLPAEAAAEKTVAVPIFIAEGYHVREDIPALLDVASQGGIADDKQIPCTDPIGTHRLVAEIAFDRAKDTLHTAGWGTDSTDTPKPSPQSGANIP